MSAADLHHKLEKNAGLLIFGILFVSAIGGLVQVLPSVLQESLQTPTAAARPYTALELEGRDLYIREGCSTCHSQQIRPLLAEVKRYGRNSESGEFVYDRPFLWGSKRTGPDLHRVGGKYSDAWHRMHLINPRSVVPNSIMPAYPWLETSAADRRGDIEARVRTLQKLGHPYSEEDAAGAARALDGRTEMDAVIAYLQVLGSFGHQEVAQ